MIVSKICLTGGPCGGKSSSLKYINEKLTNLGYKVIIVNETATELNVEGKITGKETDDEFANMIIHHQLQKEVQAENYANSHPENYVIVCDRSIIEPAAYIGVEKVSNILAKLGKKFEDVRDSYNLVIHLTTVAKDVPEFYTLENNTARNSSIAKAILIDDNELEIWSKHHNRIIINNIGMDFEEKLKKVEKAIIDNIKPSKDTNNYER